MEVEGVLPPSRRPLKQVVRGLKGSLPETRLWKEKLERQWELEAKLARKRKVEAERERRAAIRRAPETEIERQAKKRRKLLELAVRTIRGSKRLEQLHGREQELATFWQAGKLAELRLGRSPSDAEWGAQFVALRGEGFECTKHQARSLRRLAGWLETDPMVWGRIASAA